MKPSYKFIESLHSTLFSQGDEWASSIKAEIEKKQSKLASLQPEARTAVELNIDKLREDVDKVVYSWNVKPFNSMENAKLLLANAHLLDDPILSTHFNPQAVIALKNMLRENFGKIYKDNDAKDVYETQKSLDLAFNDVPLKILPKILNEELLVKDDFRTSEELEQLMNPEDGESDEWEDVEDEEEGEELDTDEEEPQEGEELDADEEEENAEAEEAFNQFISTIIANNKHIDLVFTKQIAEILSITERFYTNSANISPMLALTMSSFFTNIDDVTTFLGNKVDYTSTTTVENSFPPIFQIPNICVITKQEREMWSELNAQYGKKSMSMFVKRDELSTKIDLEALFKEDDLESIFNQLTETAKQLEFTRASEHPELAKMVADFDMPEKTFERILDDIIPSAKEMDDLPDINFSINYKDNILTFQKLPAGDIKGLFLGKMTGCCQSVEGDAEKAVIAGFTRADAGFYTLTDKDGKVKAQSYAWIGVRDGKKVLVLDSFEHNQDVKSAYIPVMKQLAKAMKSTDFEELHVGTGGNTPETKAKTGYDIKTQGKDLYRYSDSHNTYHITEEVSLPDECTEPPKYSDFDDYFSDNHNVAFNKLYAIDERLVKKIAEEGGGLVLREFRVVHLLLEDAKLRDFIAQNLEELSQKGFNVTAICNVQISYLHKLTILKTLIDRDISDQEVIETFTKYYGIDPAILEHFGYEHISKLADLCMPLIECRTSSIDLERTIPLIKRAMDGDITSERMSSLSTLYSLAHPELIAEFGEEKLLQIKSSMFYRALAKDSEVELSIQKDLIQRTLDGQLTEQMLTNLMQMHKLILNAFGIDALIPYCLKEYLPMLMYTDHQLSIEERIGIIRQVLGSDIENKEAFLCHAGNIDLAILTHFTLEKLMPLLNQLYTPNVLNSWSTELTTDQKIKLIDEVMTDTPEDKIFTTLNTLGSLHPAIITSFPLEILKSFIGQYGNMPSILCGGEEPLEQTIELVKTTLEREPQDAKEILFKLSSIDSKIVTALGEKLLPLCKNHYIPNVLGVFDSSITPEAKLALMEMLITKDLGENMVHVLRNIDNLATKYSVENISKILDAIKTLPPLYVHPTLYQMSQADTTILETITIEDMVRLCTTNTSNTAKLPSADIVFKALQPHSDLPEHVEVNYNTKISIDDTVHIAQSITFHQLGELVTNINLLGFYKNTESLNCYYDGNHYHIQAIGQDDITIEHI